MILPIVAYGDPILKKRATEITSDYKDLKTLIANMSETMYGAYGVGLAAPQIGLSVRIFLVDTAPFAEDESYSEAERKGLKSFKKTFINPEILEESGYSIDTDAVDINSSDFYDGYQIRIPILKENEELLEDFAYKNILRLRKVYNDQHIQDVMERMERYEGDPNDMNDLLVEFIQLKEIQKNISQELGTVIEK